MATNNLRIIYNNVADLTSTTITASSTNGSTSTANLKKDTKSLIWRSNSNSATLTTTFSSSTIVSGIIMPFCNLTPTATANVTLSGTSFGTKYICPYEKINVWGWDSSSLGVNSYAYGGGNYARFWVTPTLCSSVIVTITDPALSFIELSRLVIGDYWSPTYNTSFGLSTNSKDLSSHQRTESGDLITIRGIRTNTMSFDMTWLTPTDRQQFSKIIKGNGLPKPLFISLFPDNSDDWNKEQAHQIYGKLSQLSAIQHPVFESYSTQVEIEEI